MEQTTNNGQEAISYWLFIGQELGEYLLSVIRVIFLQ
jgi:hypothetical protein